MRTMFGTFGRRSNWVRAARLFALMGVSLLLVSADASAQQRRNGGGFSVAGRRPPDVPPVIGKPLETREPLGKGQEPAFKGQTRAVAVATKMPLKVDVIARGLRNPWSLAFLPDGKMLIAEKPGAMRVVTSDGTIGEPIEGVPKVVFGGDAGLFDVALDPSFATNRIVYFTYVEPRERGNGVALAKAKLSDDLKRLYDLAVLMRVEPNLPMPAHYGSRLIFDKEGKLLISLAERLMSPYREQAQKLDSRLGKILRLNTDGTPAPGNPFANTPGASPEVWSYGHRNPQGLTFHPVTGELWDTEHGPQAGDEVNVVTPGKNYGWPTIAYGTEYTGEAINGGLTKKEGMEQPVYYWDPAIAPSGATFYSGDLIPEWKNNLFVAALAGQHVSRLVLDGHRVVGEERLLLDQRQRMRDVRQGPDGALWVLSDDRDGRLIRIAAGDQTSARTVAPQAGLTELASASEPMPGKSQPTLEKLWETKPVFKFAEAAVFEPNGKFLLVSNTDGSPMAKDGKGSIGKLALDGTVMEVDWVKGLDAPKGIGLYKTRLYVADLSDVVVVDVEKAAVVERIPIKGARLLHNIDIDPNGVVYVSDMFTGKVHRIEGHTVSTYLENLRGPAGVLVDGTDLYVYTGQGLLKADAEKKVMTVAKGLDGRANGIVKVKEKEFILTSWGGIAYYVFADGSHHVLLDTRSSRTAAGINLFDPKKRVMYMTTDEHNTVAAFTLK